MANLTKDRVYRELAGAKAFNDPVAAATTIYRGAMVGLDGDGNAVPAAPATPVIRGVAKEMANNSSGAAGAVSVDTAKGVFHFNQTGLSRSDIESDVYVVDDNTVGAAGTLIAGRLVDIDAAGAWVEIR